MTNTASIHSLYQDDRSRAESAAWAQFTAATSSSELNSSWLSILCGQIEQARGGLLLLRASEDGEGSYGVAAVWPDPGRNMQYLAPAAEKTLRDRAGVVLSAVGGWVSQVAGMARVRLPVRTHPLHAFVTNDFEQGLEKPDAELPPEVLDIFK